MDNRHEKMIIDFFPANQAVGSSLLEAVRKMESESSIVLTQVAVEKNELWLYFAKSRMSADKIGVSSRDLRLNSGKQACIDPEQLRSFVHTRFRRRTQFYIDGPIFKKPV